MRLITFGKINLKFLIIVSIYIGIILVLNSISIGLKNSDDSIKKILKNIPIMLIIIHGSLIFYIILEYWRNKLISKKVSNNEINEGNDSRIIYLIYLIYLYNLPQKKNIKKIISYYFNDYFGFYI